MGGKDGNYSLEANLHGVQALRRKGGAGGMKNYILWFVFISLIFSIGAVDIVLSEDMITVKGKLVGVDEKQKTIVVDSNGVATVIVFDDEKIFSRIDRLHIEIGDKISVRYMKRGNKNIGKYIRSLKGC